MGISIVVENTVQGFGFRRLFDEIIIDKRIAYPIFSAAGLTEIGLISLIAGVPLLVLAWFKSRRAALMMSGAFALPGLIFLATWWPPGAPVNLDLLMAAFPGLFRCVLAAGVFTQAGDVGARSDGGVAHAVLDESRQCTDASRLGDAGHLASWKLEVRS
jgi:hypothetical protein